MNGPSVSVVMSVYNDEQYLCLALESVLAQSFTDFEFIIVNDGSTDGSREILADYGRRDQRIRLIDQENQGLTMALIRGCEGACGQYIARQDADDWSHPERFLRCVDLLNESQKVVMASSWAEYIDPLGDVIECVERPADPETATLQLLHERIGPPAHGSVMFRRSAYQAAGGYRSCFYFAQDSDLWLRLGRLGWVCYVQEYLYHYRVSPKTISGANSRMQWEFGELGQKCSAAWLKGERESIYLEQAEHLRTQVRRGKRSLWRSRLEEAAANYRIGTSLSCRGNPRARGYFWSAIRLNPLHWRSWIRLLYGEFWSGWGGGR